MDARIWHMELQRLQQFFENRSLPKSIKVGGFMTVNDTQFFLDACINGAATAEGNLQWNGNLHRLQLLEQAVLDLEALKIQTS